MMSQIMHEQLHEAEAAIFTQKPSTHSNKRQKLLSKASIARPIACLYSMYLFKKNSRCSYSLSSPSHGRQSPNLAASH